jgi:DNA-directed RNA polymerase specialized sigma24 family protein
VALRYFVDMDATEIGLVLKMPPATVRSHLRRALLSLRTALRTVEELPTERTQREGETAC